MRLLLFLLLLTTALLVMRSSDFTPEVIYLEASKDPIRVKPMNVWTQDVPNSEHEDKCIFTNYQCDEQFYLILEDLEDNCCLKELITES